MKLDGGEILFLSINLIGFALILYFGIATILL